MEDERERASARGVRQRHGGPESGNGTALRHSDTRARVKWRRVRGAHARAIFRSRIYGSVCWSVPDRRLFLSEHIVRAVRRNCVCLFVVCFFKVTVSLSR